MLGPTDKSIDHSNDTSSSRKTMPDVSHEVKPTIQGRLDQVGMGQIEIPVRFELPGEDTVLLPARVDAFVSLEDPTAKGIHMSRLYLQLEEILSKKTLNFEVMKALVDAFVHTQKGLSHAGFLRIKFDLPVRREALLSGETGWRQYPVVFEARKVHREYDLIMGAQVLYSSTCPCSAALARQLVREKFLNDFQGEKQVDTREVAKWMSLESSIIATPHAQRSVADFKLKVSPEFKLSVLDVIDLVEESLGTPVQAAVKREDEQEFARLNSQNLMFCEDAGRKLRYAFEHTPYLLDYWARVEHQESLHPHTAVAMVVKGITGGFTATI